MKTKVPFLTVLALLAAVLFAGCSTPDTRIRKNPEAFNRLTPEEQQLIREGKVAIGFDQEMVKLAVGDPDRVWYRTDAAGATESWSYTAYEYYDGVHGWAPLYRGWYHRYYGWRDPFYPYYLSYPGRKEREVFKVVFKDGKVISIEQEGRT